MRLVVCTIVVLLLVGCGASRDLKRAKQLIKRAEQKGALVSRDTTWSKIKFTAPAVSFETTVTQPDWSRPLVIKGKDSVRIEVRRIPATPTAPEKVYIKADCPEQEVEKEIPIAIDTTISAGYTLWEMIVLGVFAFVVGYGARVVHVMVSR